MSEHVETAHTSPTICGNLYDKYHSRNPVARWLMDRFLATACELARDAQSRSVLEVGCGEGHLARHLIDHGPPMERFAACDLSLARVPDDLRSRIQFREANAYSLPYANREFELVVCCEVLEHLDAPERVLAEITRVARRAVLVSTPREPLWRLLNLVRGAYWSDWGNTPGHVQHWSSRGLRTFVSRALVIRQVRYPIPWTIVLGEPQVEDVSARVIEMLKS